MDILTTVLTSSVIVALINGIFELIRSSKSRKSGLEKGVQLLLLDSLKRQGRAYLNDGHISLEELNAFKETYTTYKGLGGNGYADLLLEQVSKLPKEEYE